MRDYEGTCWTQDRWFENGKKSNTDPESWGIKVLTGVDRGGLSRQQGVAHLGSNSGYQALNLAYLLGAERIILLGFDMMVDGDKRHWFGDHPGILNRASDYAGFAARFDSIVPAQYGIEIWNCSRRTALKAFPKHDLDECLASL